MAATPGNEVPLPENIRPFVGTTLAWDNIDRLEETLSGGGTSHRVNGIAVQVASDQRNLASPKHCCCVRPGAVRQSYRDKMKHSAPFSAIVLRMVVFHTICTFLAVIGKRFQDAGLRDVCV